MPDPIATPISLPSLELKPGQGECFECYCARLLVVYYEHLTAELGYSHRRAANSLGVERASLYQRLIRARERRGACSVCRPQSLPVPSMAGV